VLQLTLCLLDRTVQVQQFFLEVLPVYLLVLALQSSDCFEQGAAPSVVFLLLQLVDQHIGLAERRYQRVLVQGLADVTLPLQTNHVPLEVHGSQL